MNENSVAIVLQSNEGGKVEYLCYGKKIKGINKIMVFDDVETARRNWRQRIFKVVSDPKQEFYQKLFLAMYEPVLVKATMLTNNVETWGKIENPFFSLSVGRIKSNIIDEVLESTEPLVSYIRAPKVG